MSSYGSNIDKSSNLMRVGLILLLVTTSIVFIPVLVNYLLIRTFFSIIAGYSYNYNLFYSLAYFVIDYGFIFEIIGLILVLATFILISIGMFSLGSSGNTEIRGMGIAGGIFFLLSLVLELVSFIISFIASSVDFYTLLYSLFYGGLYGGVGALPYIEIAANVFYFIGFLLLGLCLKNLKRSRNLNKIGIVSSYFYIPVIFFSILPFLPASPSTMGGLLFLLYSGDFSFLFTNLIISIEAIIGISQLRNRSQAYTTPEPRISNQININTMQDFERNTAGSSPEKKFCEHCGAPRIPNTKFCAMCGAAYN